MRKNWSRIIENFETRHDVLRKSAYSQIKNRAYIELLWSLRGRLIYEANYVV